MINITKDGGDVRAYFINRPELYMVGVSMNDAVGALINTYGQSMGIGVEYEGDKATPPAKSVHLFGQTFCEGDKILISVKTWNRDYEGVNRDYEGVIDKMGLIDKINDNGEFTVLLKCSSSTVRYTINTNLETIRFMGNDPKVGAKICIFNKL